MTSKAYKLVRWLRRVRWLSRYKRVSYEDFVMGDQPVAITRTVFPCDGTYLPDSETLDGAVYIMEAKDD